MITVNIFHSAVKENFVTYNRFDEGKSIRELFPDIDFTNAAIGVNGIWEDENKVRPDAGYVLRDGDLCTIRLFPAQGNRFNNNIIDYFLPKIKTFFKGTVKFFSGAVKFFSGATSSEFTATVGNSPSQTAEIPQLKGAKNQSAADKPIPIVLGRHLFTPCYIGKPYTTIDGVDGEDQYFHCLYLLGYGKLKVTDIQLGPVSVLSTAGNSGGDGILPVDGNSIFAEAIPELELWQGPNPEREDGEAALYPQKVTEEQVGNIELLHTAAIDKDGIPEKTLKVDRFTDKNPMKVQVEFLFPGGLLTYDKDNNEKSASVSIQVQWRKGQNDAPKPFGPIGTGNDYDPSTGTTTITRTKNKMMRFVAEHDFQWEDISDVPSRALELRIERTNAQAIDTKTSDKVYLTAIRTWCFDYDKSEAKGTLVPQVPMIPKYRDITCRLGFKIKAADSLNGTIDALNCIVQSYARTWGGTSWSVEETPANNPAAIALKVLQCPSLGSDAYIDQTGASGYLPAWCRPRTRYDNNGRPYTVAEDRESMLDLDSFGEFYEWCEGREYFAGNVLVQDPQKFTVNGVLTTEKRVDDVLAAVLSTGRAMRILNGSKYAVLIDKPRSVPATMLNNKNVLEAANQKAFEDTPDGFSVKFIDETNGFQEAEGYVMRQNAAYPSGYEGALLPEAYADAAIEKIEVPWVTDWWQAVKNARYLLKCRYIRTEIWNRKVSVDGYLVGIGSLVDIQDDTIVVGIGDGADITGFDTDADESITGIHTNGVFDVSDTSKRYGLKIMQFDGEHTPQARVVEVIVPEAGRYGNFTLVGPLLKTDALKPSAGDVLSFGILDKITIPALCIGKKDSGDGRFDLVFSPYDESIYDDSGIVRDLDAKITTPQKPISIPEIPRETVTREEAVQISQNFGVPGPPATVYKVLPGVSVIKRYNTGVTDPPTVSCIQQSITGNDPPVESNKTLTYITSEGTETLYEGEIAVGDWDRIEFRLYDDEDNLLDREDVPVLTDGPPAVVYHLIPGVPMIIRNPSGEAVPAAVSCSQMKTVGNNPPAESDKVIRYITSASAAETLYTGPVPVAWDWIEFRLYDGSKLLDSERIPVVSDGAKGADGVPGAPGADGATTYTWIKYADNADGTGLYDTPTANTKYIGIAVNKTTSTESPNPADYVWSLFKGENSVIIDIDNANVSVNCDAYGVPYPGALPLTSRAVLYDGETPASPAWSLESPPSGVSIAQDGTITVARDAALGNFNSIRVKAVYKGVDHYHVFNIGKTLDGESPVTLDLLPANEVIQCDYQGNPLRGLPLTARATLYKGTREITAAMELAEAAKVDIVYYPGDIFDPMLGDFYPALGYPVIWSLAGAPFGVTIDRYGLITVSGAAELDDINEITVQAEYHGRTYEAVFGITKTRGGTPGEDGEDGIDGRGILGIVSWYYRSDSMTTLTGGTWSTTVPDRRSGKYIWQKTVTTYTDGTTSETDPVCITGEQGADSGRYRGVTTVADTGNTGVVTLQGGGEAAMNDLDRVLFMGADVNSWVKFRVMRWDAVARTWAALTPESSQVEYMEALNDMTEDAPDGVFSNVFCRVLFAQQASINMLQTYLFTLTHKNDNFPGIIQSSNYNKENRSGFQLNSNGEINAYELDTWHIRTLIDENPGQFATSLMRGTLRGVYTFYYNPNSTHPVVMGLIQKNFARLDRDASKPGVFKLRLVFDSKVEAEKIQFARIFGYYSRTEKESSFSKQAGSSKFTYPGQWGIITQSSRLASTEYLGYMTDMYDIIYEGSIADVISSSGYMVDYVFACKDNNADNSEEDPLWYATLFLVE